MRFIGKKITGKKNKRENQMLVMYAPTHLAGNYVKCHKFKTIGDVTTIFVYLCTLHYIIYIWLVRNGVNTTIKLHHMMWHLAI